MKTVILGVDENNRPIWNATFKDFAATLGFVPRVCRARRPQTKGKVESGIGFVKIISCRAGDLQTMET